MTPEQVDAVRACNQALTNAAANNPNAPGAASLKLWLSGAVRPFGYRTLYPGTEVTPR